MIREYVHKHIWPKDWTNYVFINQNSFAKDIKYTNFRADIFNLKKE